MLKSDLHLLCSQRGIKCPLQISKPEIIKMLLAPKTPLTTSNISIVKAYIAKARRGENVARDLDALVCYYDWTGHRKLKKEAMAIIKNQPSTLVEISPSKRAILTDAFFVDQRYVVKEPTKDVVEPTKAIGPKYIPGNYNHVDILNVTLGKKEYAPLPSTRISITLNELRKEVDKPSFIKNFANASKDLMTAKVDFYTRKIVETQKENLVLRDKIRRLKLAGMSDKAIDDYYPCRNNMEAFLVDLEDLVSAIKGKANTTSEQIKKGLIEAIDDPDQGISSLVGIDEVKDQIASQLYSFSKGYKTFMGSFNNIALYGPAGIGKTRVAQAIAFVFSKVGILATDRVKIATRAELIGQFIGQTAPRTRSILFESLEGVLFIDEAYQLTMGGANDFGAEAITVIVDFLYNYVGMNITIVAGYEDLMVKHFMTYNEGLPRRFPYRYILTPYSDAQLTDILVNNLKRKVPETIDVDQNICDFLFSMISKIRSEFPDAIKYQAGDMLNLSASLNKAITSSFKIKWKNGKPNIPILVAGFDDFLSTKGYRAE